MAGKRFTYLCVLAVAAAFYLAYGEWFSWVALLAVLGLPWLSLLVSLPGILTFRAEVEGPERIPLGQDGEVKLTGSSRFPVPPFTGKLRVTRLLTGEWRVCRGNMILVGDHCGGRLAVPEKVRVCDYLGLFRFPAGKGMPRTVLVRPEPVQMERPPELQRYLARSWRPKPGGGFAENHELRLYRPGDSLNQVHWKLTAKTGQLTIREAMEPDRGLVLLTLDIRGTEAELDDKFGRLLWLGSLLLEERIPFEIRALTAEGILAFPVKEEPALKQAVDKLLCSGPAAAGSVRDVQREASWIHYIGGASDEA